MTDATATPETHRRAIALIDAAHAADPTYTPDGRPAELVYAERMVAWGERLATAAHSPLAALALRCQHLERFLTPRDTFPEGRAGYYQWRTSLYTKQGDRARDLLLEAGCDAADAERVRSWVAKENLRADPNSQLLEDCAILVFLENHIADFAAQHADYTREKWIRILQKSWTKLSPRGREAALTLAFPPAIGELVQEAVAGA
ncbi:DUF4202 domain-containing protein [Actomonas aquatica]|uniref:DUF4202 domain-containing protein n=1 Tax=Actomonas aquatica TaxID=2866162 RepID=A0ABZ1C3W1_9BACT|nr:DUF4202 domain-containing protein [Opitutus sp. WL0086]WRQ85983.1 DUF4202 domain-containing protein [Opitutus sp. WL0086]